MSQKIKKFGFWSIVLLTVNAVIGTGIFLSPAGVIKTAGVYTPLIYLLAALLATVLAITFSSAAKYTNKNGAAYAYTKVAFGSSLGFYVGITRFTAGAIAWGVMATAVIRTSLGILGVSKDKINNTSITIGFLILMVILLLIIFSGTYITKIFSNISTIGKILALVIAILAGLFIFLKTGTSHFNEISTLTNADGELVIKPMNTTVFVGAILSAFYAYTGFESVASAASEMVEPQKNLPRAIPVGIAIIAAIYIGVVSIAMVINPIGLLQSNEVVLLAAAYNNIIIKKTIIYGALLSMFGINIAAAFSTPRIFEAMASEGQMPNFLSYRTKRGVPVYAFLVTAALAIIVPMSFNYDMRGIMIISSVSRFIQFLIVPIAVITFYFGKTSENILKAHKNVITDIVIPIIAFLFSAFLMIKFDWVKAFSNGNKLNMFAIIAMLLGYVVLPLIFFIPMKMGKFKNK